MAIWHCWDNGVVLTREESLRLYRWGEPRPIWTRAFKGDIAALAATESAVYVATATRLHRLPRRAADPPQTFDLPTLRGRATGMLASERGGTTFVLVLTEQGVLWGAHLPEARWQEVRLSRSALQRGALYQQQVAVSDADGAVFCVDVERLEVRRRWSGGLGGVLDYAWHPQGRWVAGACADGLVKVWSPETGQCLQAFAAHRLFPSCVACHPDGSQLVSYGGDGLLFLYDLGLGRALLDRPLVVPREVAQGLGLRWALPTQLWLFTGSAFVGCQLPAGRWRTQALQ
ncbi:hypothetical protein HRbin15_00047 [bacterium HR15]|nr:hypothetical protein HRbin15_00047 [bacterium HR15]